MRRSLTRRTWRALIGFMAVAAIAITVNILPSKAEKKWTTRVGPEVKAGGLTVAEEATRQRELHAKLSAMLPAGASKTPLSVEITEKDRFDLSGPAPNGTAPMRVGVVKAVPGAVGKPFGKAFNHGVIRKSLDGTFVWAMTVTSPGAQAIRVHFTRFSLPDSTEMYFLGPNGQAHGPYIGSGRNGNGDFWTRSIVSDTGTIFLRYTGYSPDRDQPRMSFVLSDVGHISGRLPLVEPDVDDYWPCMDNAPCLLDVNCMDTGPAAQAEDAVAKMEWIEGPYIYTCTGGLLADTDPGTQIPYFLTANHCLSSDNPNLETFFNYTTDSCEGLCPGNIWYGTPPPASTVGVTVMATGAKGDYTLLTLDQDPPAGAVFLGWNNSEIAYSDDAPLYRISNANFGPQVYSHHLVDATTSTCAGWPRGERIYSVNLDGEGATMGGSSGSPVLNSAGEVVGQLSGCCGYNCGDDCDWENNWTVDGALYYYWDSVSEFLEPQGCTTDEECDDGLFCTGTETCVSGTCESSGDPCPGGTVCNEATDTCDPEGCTTDEECDDGLFCTGVETCVSGTCESSGDPCPGGTVCNEETDTCDPQACDSDGSCEAGEDCNNCPNDCRQKTTGKLANRYCCDGDLTDCGNPACSEDGWSCGGGGGCTSDVECDDGLFCNGAETCVAGTCQPGTDPCPGQECDETNDVCVDDCATNKEPCNTNSDCCSNRCVGGSCRGN